MGNTWNCRISKKNCNENTKSSIVKPAITENQALNSYSKNKKNNENK